MAALAQLKISNTAPAPEAAPAPRLANDTDAAHPTLVHAQRIMLESAFAEPDEKPFPPAVKLALLIGVPILLWASAAIGAISALRMMHP
jgi:hypothetical protein